MQLSIFHHAEAQEEVYNQDFKQYPKIDRYSYGTHSFACSPEDKKEEFDAICTQTLHCTKGGAG